MKTLIAQKNGELFARTKHHSARHPQKSDLRKEYRRGESERVERSASLALVYPRLRTLTVDLLYFDREIVSWGHGLKYRANLETAKSVLRFSCPSPLCKGGDFELSQQLRSAIAECRKTVSGEVRCLGSRDQDTGNTVGCESMLRFKMNLAFKTRAVAISMRAKLNRRGAAAHLLPHRSLVAPALLAPNKGKVRRTRAGN